MNSLFIGHTRIKLHEVNSTNTYAIELLKQEKVYEGTLIYSLNQTNGRGQRGNNWQSEPFKNLTFSIVLTPHFLPISNQFLLTQAVSLAICDFVAALDNTGKLNDKIAIKWPNDILLNNKKVCGILIENSIRETSIQHTVVGVGINVNQKKFDLFPTQASSLSNEFEEEFDTEEILAKICTQIDKRYLQIRNQNGQNQVREGYLGKLKGLGLEQQFMLNTKLVDGVIKGVSPIGELLVVLNGEDEFRKFGFKEIQLVVA
ncbi:MAG: biotin--[acetyl-CoA-carboxylase] ligase [Bacteroidetes bacterium]|nr:biotin--[acetyl-CoA-carboxylase] ligase [Bacteroidota bacterium]